MLTVMGYLAPGATWTTWPPLGVTDNVTFAASGTTVIAGIRPALEERPVPEKKAYSLEGAAVAPSIHGRKERRRVYDCMLNEASNQLPIPQRYVLVIGVVLNMALTLE